MAKWGGLDFRGVNDFETMGIKLNRAFAAQMNHIDHNNIPQIYTNYCDIKSEDGEMQIDGPTQRFYGTDTSLQRMNVGWSTATSDFGFTIWNTTGGISAYIDSTGELIVRRLLAGYVQGSTIEGSQITASTLSANYITASSIAASYISGSTIEGSQITGSTIIGGTIKTNETGQRIEMSNNSQQTYNASNVLNGICWGTTDVSATYGDVGFYDEGTLTLLFRNNIGSGYSILPANTASLYINSTGYTCYLQGAIEIQDTVGFFGSTAVGKTAVATVSSDATLVESVNKLNEVIAALQGYGLL